MRISRQKIELVADKAVAPLDKEKEELRQEMGKKLSDYINQKYTPDEVRRFREKYPNFVSSQGNIWVVYTGLHGMYVPCNTPELSALGINQGEFTKSEELKTILYEDFKTYSDIYKNSSAVKNKIICVLNKLRTYERVKKELPDLYDILLQVDKEQGTESFCDSIESIQATIKDIKSKEE